LSQDPLSVFRYSIHLFSHQDRDNTCLSPNRLSTFLQKGLSGLSVSSYEICRVLNPDNDSLPEWVDSLLGNIHQFNSRIILKRSPDLTTLQVSAGNMNIPRERVFFDSKKNEILLDQTIASQLKLGDEIQVKYVPKK
jgi:hypothetical protein